MVAGRIALEVVGTVTEPNKVGNHSSGVPCSEEYI